MRSIGASDWVSPLMAAAPQRRGGGRRRRRTPAGGRHGLARAQGGSAALPWGVAVGRRRQAAMPGDDAALAAALQHRMDRDHPRVFQDAHLAGGGVHLHRPPASGVGHAVEIAADRDHAVAGDAPLEAQHRLERAGRQRQQMRAFLGKVFGDDAPCGRMHAGVGDIVLPLPELRVEVVEILEAAAEEEVLAHIAEWTLYLALGLYRQQHPVPGCRRQRPPLPTPSCPQAHYPPLPAHKRKRDRCRRMREALG